jgi:hypothetical protein
MCSKRLGLLAFVWFVGAAATADAGSVFGPVRPYEQFSDSPFASQSFSYFHLETFESGMLAAPGVTASAGVVIGPSFLTDSVEPFGTPNNGNSYYFGDGPTGIKFSFDAGVLGHLPTSAAIAWTDGYVPITFQAFDAAKNLIGTITDNAPGDFRDGDGNPEHFRLFGAVDGGGISSIYINTGVGVGGGIEVDDLQYGFQASTRSVIPEPTSLTLFSIAALGVLGYTWRKRKSRPEE